MKPTTATRYDVRSSPPRRSRRGFTLIELMVVIGILVLLVALMLPSVTSLLSGNKAKLTMATMQSVEQAILLYQEERPLAKSRIVLRERPTGGTPAYVNEYARDVFGPWPPSPTARLAINPGDNRNVVAPAWSVDPAEGDELDASTVRKFEFLAQLAFGQDWGDPLVTHEPDNDSLTKYMSSECLLLFLTNLSSGARAIIDKLPDNAKTNKDKDLICHEADSGHDHEHHHNHMDLFELVDAWGNPIRYAVKEPIVSKKPNGEVETTFAAIWELRSAGPNEKFGDPFSDDAAPDSVGTADDVVLRR